MSETNNKLTRKEIMQNMLLKSYPVLYFETTANVIKTYANIGEFRAVWESILCRYDPKINKKIYFIVQVVEFDNDEKVTIFDFCQELKHFITPVTFGKKIKGFTFKNGKVTQSIQDIYKCHSQNDPTDDFSHIVSFSLKSPVLVDDINELIYEENKRH